MTAAESLLEGLALTGIGMGVVFTFLIVLVMVTNSMSRLVLRFAPEAVTAVQGGPTPGARLDDAQLIAIISAAIHQHRARK
jgi:oxaloacetate decarboxylase gamma subunit